jgi:hypothetical protein
MTENELEEILFSLELITDDYEKFAFLGKKKVKNIKNYIF